MFVCSVLNSIYFYFFTNKWNTFSSNLIIPNAESIFKIHQGKQVIKKGKQKLPPL